MFNKRLLAFQTLKTLGPIRSFRRIAFSIALVASLMGLTNCNSSSAIGGGNATLTSIQIIPAKPSVAVGASTQLKATGTYSDGSSGDITTTANWSSSDTTQATIQTTGQTDPGLATGVAQGAPTITASVGSVTTTATLNVVVNTTLTSVAVSPTSTTISVGASAQFTATGTFSDGSKKNITSGATWSSSDTTKATIETEGQSKPGLATGVAKGSATITATLNGVGGSATLNVVPPSSLIAITVEPTNTSIAIDAQEQFSATGTFSDGTIQDITSTASWVSSNTADVTIETSGQQQPGLATGVAAGSVTISASQSGITDQTNLSVTNSNANIVAIKVDPVDATIAAGTTMQFFATAVLDDGTSLDLTESAGWTSSNPSAATIELASQSQPGLATGVAQGTTTLSAASNGVTGSTSLTMTLSSGNGRKTPITDMNGTGNYLSFEGGLYGSNSNTVPAAHDADGKTIAATIQPLDSNGNPSATGKVVFASIGMSNAADEFGAFIENTEGNTQVNQSTLVIANGAKGGVTACDWVVAEGSPPCAQSEGNQFDRVQTQVLPPLGVTEQQIQIAWIKEANGGPGQQGCGADATDTSEPCRALCDGTVAGCVNSQYGTEALRYETQLGQILRAAKTRWPNLKLAFISNRIYGGYATDDLSPEPYSYEYGFSTQFLMMAQVKQIANGTIDPIAGDLNYTNGTAPWVAWGPYLWANGATPRSDGLIWCNGQTAAPCSGEVDFQSDGTHPDTTGQQKVATLLINFFLNSPYTKSWFAAKP